MEVFAAAVAVAAVVFPLLASLVFCVWAAVLVSYCLKNCACLMGPVLVSH